MRKKNFGAHMFIFTIPVILLLAACFLFFSNAKVSANTVGLSEVTKIESVLVKKGDTLSDIANKYADQYSQVPAAEYLEQIITLNNLSSEYISAGSYILLPNYNN